MPGSRMYMLGFDEGREVSVEQKFALGSLGQDRIGNRWSYVQFTAALQVGEWVADRLHTGEVDVATASDDELIIATSDLQSGDVYRGAFGLVTSSTGAKQGFVITGVYTQGTNTHFQIHVLNDATSRKSRTKWATALTATSKVTLMKTGVVVKGVAGSAEFVRGVVQTTVPAPETGVLRFGWVQQTGVALCALNGTNLVAANKSLNYSTTDGRFVGINGTTGPARRLSYVDYANTAGDVVLAEIRIENNATSPVEAPRQGPIGLGPAVIR